MTLTWFSRLKRPWHVPIFKRRMKPPSFDSKISGRGVWSVLQGPADPVEGRPWHITIPTEPAAADHRRPWRLTGLTLFIVNRSVFLSLPQAILRTWKTSFKSIAFKWIRVDQADL